ncbi:hypothetical protein [Pseudorhodoferax sp. Leaf274]|uniref:hypothetical protein n=1 Tax=Pseudorhodoferax sp. Leaf274 TaxID=1736318 RepID=UPI00070332EF|nr:hypothetical protein [Pseudorhodoferax sp. Leaf274]KQP36096.1 hypothetical protein ASF44_16130 [Pseudorhodoferax sp. Leaf274]
MAYEILQTCFLVPNVSVSNCSGWVQAWGTLAALIATFFVVRYQGQQARIQADSQRRAVKIEKFMTVHGVLMHVASAHTIAAITLASADPEWSSASQEADEALSGLASLRSSPFELPHFELVWRLDLLIQDMRSTRRLLSAEIAVAKGEDDEILPELQRRESRVLATAVWCTTQAHDLADEPGKAELLTAMRRASESAS